MKIKYEFVNGEHFNVEVSEEIGSVILQMRREEKANDARCRYHNYALDAVDYEGEEYGYIDENFFRLEAIEDKEFLRKALNTLTDNQRRRLMMYAQGLSSRRIAEIEGVDHKMVIKSIEGARKKFLKFFRKIGPQNGSIFWV